MADELNQDETTPNEAPKKKLPLKTLAILGGVLLLEVVTVIGTFMLSVPADSIGDPSHPGPIAPDAGEREIEVMIIEGRFSNSKRGDVYFYDTEIWISVKKKDVEQIEAVLKEKSATVQSAISTIFRGAEPSYMHEDKLLSLNRQIKHVLDGVLRKDADGESVVKKVLITRCDEYRADR